MNFFKIQIITRRQVGMIIFTAIDILDVKCVRLIQGDYNQEKVYSDSPVEMAKEWEKKGASFIHIVDLNEAKSVATYNEDINIKLAKSVSVPIQVGGGIRSLPIIKKYLEADDSRVIVGTAAITDTDILKEAVDTYGEKIV